MRILAVTAAALLLAVLVPPPSGADAKWTFLVYLDADNNLEEVGIDDFLEMATVGSTADVNIVAQFDRSTSSTGGGSTRYGDWTDTKRFLITEGMEPLAGSSLPFPIQELNMGHPQTLVDFLEWAMGTPSAPGPYRAERYFLDLWDHGTAWTPVVHDGGDILTPAEIAWALDRAASITGERIDLLGNDACRMTLEILYELRDEVDLFIGSEKDTPLEGWPYDRLLQAWTADPAMGPGDLAAALADAYYDSYVGQTQYAVTLAVVSAASLDALVDDLNPFADELIAYFPYFALEIQNARGATEHYEAPGGLADGNDYDLYHFTETVEANVPSPRLARMARELRAAIEASVVYERHWDNPDPVNNVRATHAHGLSLFFPSGFPPSGYFDLQLSQNSSCDSFLATYGGGVPVVLDLRANTSAEDLDADGFDDLLRVTATPSVGGVVAVEVTGPRWSVSREIPAAAGEEVTFLIAPPLPGAYDVAVYLFEYGPPPWGDLRNLLRPGTLGIEAMHTFSGTVTVGGAPAEGTVTLRNLRSVEELTVPVTGGAFSTSVVSPTWIADGDALRVVARTGGREMSFTLVPDLSGPPTSKIGRAPGRGRGEIAV